LARVYLTSNQSNLKGPLNGYFVMVGNTSDEISLYRQDGSNITKIIDGVDDWVNMSTVTARVRVTRDASGNWELLADSTGGFSFASQGLILDNTYPSSIYAGVHCKYTSTRSDKFYFDDFIVTGSPYVDNVLPFIQSVTATSSNTVDVLFSEDMQQSSVENPTNYSLADANSTLLGNPISALQDAGNLALVHLAFPTPFTNNMSYFLTTSNVNDLAGNTLANSVDNFVYFEPDTALQFDVLITEFMADPTPQVGLPEQEFIEIYNNSTKTFDLNNWSVGDGSSSVSLGNYTLAPGMYVILANGTSSTFGQSNILTTNIPSLNNSGDAIYIKNDLGVTIDSIYYDLSWYHDASKQDGGWSIERKRLSAQCSDVSNWAASINPFGGTPGNQNSIYTTQADTSAPIVTNYYLSGDTLFVEFDELVNSSGLVLTLSPNLNVNMWQNQNEQTIAVLIDNPQIGTIYNAILSGVTNCWGTPMATYSFMFGIPETAVKGDVVINEILFDPLTGGSDYVEIVNISDKVLSVKNWLFANIDDDTISNLKPITTQDRLFLPGEYLLISEDSNAVIQDYIIYGTGTFIDTDLPTYSNDSGSVILINNLNQILDFVHYDADYHFKLLSSTDGKALERITFSGESNNPDYWHTASEQVNWGTPGYLNSQYIDNVIEGTITLETKIFSPDNDGYQDVCLVNYNFTNPDNVMDVVVYDSEGRPIRTLKDNFYPGVNGFFTWDGLRDDGTKAQIGTYILLITVFDLDGNFSNYKEIVVVAGKL
jgi:hypothetical protein